MAEKSEQHEIIKAIVGENCCELFFSPSSLSSPGAGGGGVDSLADSVQGELDLTVSSMHRMSGSSPRLHPAKAQFDNSLSAR